MEVVVLGGFVGLFVIAAVVALLGVGAPDARTHADEIRAALASAGLQLVEVRVPRWLESLVVPAPRSGHWSSADAAVRQPSLPGTSRDHFDHQYRRVIVLDRTGRRHELITALVFHHGALLSILFDQPLDRVGDEV